MRGAQIRDEKNQYIVSTYFRYSSECNSITVALIYGKKSAKNSSNQQMKVKFDETLYYLHQRLKLTFFKIF